MGTEIQWTDETWNPVTGCSKVSPGCAHCYAEVVAGRFWAKQYPVVEVETGGPAGTQTRARVFTDVQCHDERLDQPLRWGRPRRVFVNSMSDLFHEDVPDYFIARVFSVMACARQHTFQILTKRADRMRQLVSSPEFRAEVAEFVEFWLHDAPEPPPALRWDVFGRRMDDAIAMQPDIDGDDWPLRNVWLGVSVENQHFADERIPLLLKTPAVIRFISAEPLLENILLDNGETSWLSCASQLTIEQYEAMSHQEQCDHHCCESWDAQGHHYHGVDWVIVGGESGTGARTFDVAWARSIVQQCQAAGVPVFVKQLGAKPFDSAMSETRCNGVVHYRQPVGSERDLEHRQRIANGCAPAYTVQPMQFALRNRKGGDMAEWPEDLRVRDMPTVNP